MIGTVNYSLKNNVNYRIYAYISRIPGLVLQGGTKFYLHKNSIMSKSLQKHFYLHCQTVLSIVGVHSHQCPMMMHCIVQLFHHHS